MLVGLHLYLNAASMRRQQAAVDALSSLDGVEGVNVQFVEPPRASLSGIEMLPALATDSLLVAGPGGRRKPLTREVFDALARLASARGHRYFAYVNSDIVILPAAVETVARHGRDTYAISRHDIDDLQSPAGEGVPLTAGVDMFVMSLAWWERHRRRFRPYVIGDACWDNVYTAVMMCHSNGLILNRDRLVLHERHAAVWNDLTPTARYNGFLAALDSRYFSLWCEYWSLLERGRAGESSAADEQMLRERVFVWRRSPSAALQQSVRNLRARWHFRSIRQVSPVGPAGGVS
jgi:hypothetical protein